jgi:outer membrane receptor for ferrienterochelin and colicins
MHPERRWILFLTLTIGAFLAPISAFSQSVMVSGVVTDAASGETIRGARITARSPGVAPANWADSDQRGRFRLALPAGSYTLTVSFVGYTPWEGVDLLVGDGSPVSTAVRLTRKPALLQTITVVSRDSQSIIDAPAAASVIDVTGNEVGLTPTDHLVHDPGMIVARKGLIQATFSARGPNAANSAALVVLHDYRLASVPSLRLNVPYLIPASEDDLDRIEVTRGPSSVVYGADADRGVVNFITKSPFASQGTTVSLTTGARSIFGAGFRHARQLSNRVAFKISADYFEGSDWHAENPKEVRPRDEHIQRGSTEARVDWQAGDRSTVVFSGGMAQAMNNVDLTEIGSIQVKDWRYTFGQARLVRDRLFVNLFYNQNDAGETFQLYRPDAPIVDDSRSMSAQVQYGSMLGQLELTYGFDVQRVVPRTGSTIHGRNEDRDNITMAGLYLSSTTTLSPAWSIVTSLRGDHHNQLDDVALSPRVGVVFQPAESHAVRLTWNRATSTPVANDLFLDILSRDNLNGLPFGIRARGTAEAFTFRHDCGGLCMRSPFIGDATAFVPLDATLAWPGLVEILQANQVDISQIPQPTAQNVSTVLRVLNTESASFDPVSASDVRDIPAAKRSYNSTIEAGYRGSVGSRVSLTLDLYHSSLTNVITPVSTQTPNAFLDQASLATWLANYMPTQNAAAIAAIASGIPLGTVSPEQGDSTEILVIGRQGARMSFWGADLGLTAQLTSRFSLGGSFSWASKDLVPSAGGFSDIVFNAPRRSGSLGVAYRSLRGGLTAELRGRAVSSFPVKSGEFSGEVDAYEVLDMSIGYRLPGLPTFTATLSANNLLDDRHREFAGAPVLGRLVLGRLRVEF